MSQVWNCVDNQDHSVQLLSMWTCLIIAMVSLFHVVIIIIHIIIIIININIISIIIIFTALVTIFLAEMMSLRFLCTLASGARRTKGAQRKKKAPAM